MRIIFTKKKKNEKKTFYSFYGNTNVCRLVFEKDIALDGIGIHLTKWKKMTKKV